MKRNLFITCFICTNIVFIFLHIYKHARFIKQSYRKQKNEKLYAKLIKEKDRYTHQLHTLHNHNTIKTYAQNNLGMVPMNLRQIKKVPNDS